jgi:CBS domain containing-hemolysin-like protein
MNEVLVPLAIITLLILLNALFVAAEFSIVGAAPTRIAQLAEAGSRVANRVLVILRDINRQNRYLATAQVGITVASLGLGMYGEHAVAGWLAEPVEQLSGLSAAPAAAVSATLAIVLLTYLHVVFGEMIPKSLALQASEKTVLQLQPTMTLMSRFFMPVVFFLNAAGAGFLKLIGIPPAGPGSRVMSPEELEFVVEESFAGGLIEAEEQLYIENILDLSERNVGQVMTPRNRITGIPIEAKMEGLMHLICEKGYTRYPVYDGNLDQITGILHIKNLARQLVHEGEILDMTRLLVPALFIPESVSLEEMLIRFRREGLQIAIVLDEYGGTAGLVTLEDVVEEVVGEILDEFDHEIEPMISMGPLKLRVRGDLLLDELNQHHDLHLEHPNADTVAGLVMVELGRILQPGDKVDYDGVHFEVETVKGLAVQTLLVHLPALGGDEHLSNARQQ